MAKLYFNTALLLSEILIFVNGQTPSSSSSLSVSISGTIQSTSISTTSSLSNSPTSTTTFSSTVTQDLSSTTPSSTRGVDTSSRSSSILISNVLGSSSTLTQDLSSTTVAVDPSSRSASSFVSDSMSVTSSSSASLSVSTTSPSSSQTTVTSATVQLSPTSTSTSSSVPPTAQEPSTGQPSTSSPPGLSVTIILYVKVDACDQTAGLDALIEANLPNVFRRGNVDFVLGVVVTLNSNECRDGDYVKATIIVTFSVPINFNIESVLRRSLSDTDNKLNNVNTLIIDTNEIQVVYTGLDVTFPINDEECRRVCCNGGVGGPVNIDVACTARSPDANCGNIPDEIQEDGHCPNEPYDSCSRVCNQAGFIYSPSLAILILPAVASFLKFGFF
ncbi:uncharacterized protein [Montipora foliosa]|uniref:uncharacterized protein isoform X1 n=2 Tax=Montipora foliosa TaxID=591990 RepID=UPI0035F181C3